MVVLDFLVVFPESRWIGQPILTRHYRE